MNTAITISNDLLTIGNVRLSANNHIAEAKGSDIIIVHVSDSKNKVFSADVAAVTLNGTSDSTTAEFCQAFNAQAGLSVKRNTDYPDTIISAKLTVGTVKAKVADHAKPGYVEIETDGDNSGLVYIGDTDVDNSSAVMAAEKKRYFELADLSKLYVLGSEAGQVVYVTGAYKN